MTGSTEDFTGLSETEMTALAVRRGEALQIRVVKGHLPEVLENLLILQSHTRIFTAFMAVAAGGDPQ